MNTTAEIVSFSENEFVGRIGGAVRSTDVVAAFWGGLKPSTRRSYEYSFAQYSKWCEVDSLTAASDLLALDGPAAGVRLLAYRRSFPTTLSAATVNARLAGIRSLAAFARRIGFIAWEVPIRSERVSAYRDTRGPGAEVVSRLLTKLAENSTALGRRDFAMARVLYDLGLRRGGVVGLTRDDVDLSSSRVWVRLKGRNGKVSKDLPAPTLEALKLWIEVRGSWSGPLFVSFALNGTMTKEGLAGDGLYRVVKGWGREAGIDLRPHGFRHTAISVLTRRAKAEGFGLAEIRAFSNHTSVANLTPYLDAEVGAQARLSAILAEG